MSTAASVHLLSSLSNALIFEADVGDINPFRTDLAGHAYPVVDGYVEAPDLPGLGLTIDEAVLDAHPGIPGPCYIPGA
jgi:L-alanine-DL-glutamate epimerase-like enolase superfamily enzyme